MITGVRFYLVTDDSVLFWVCQNALSGYSVFVTTLQNVVTISPRRPPEVESESIFSLLPVTRFCVSGDSALVTGDSAL